MSSSRAYSVVRLARPSECDYGLGRLYSKLRDPQDGLIALPHGWEVADAFTDKVTAAELDPLLDEIATLKRRSRNDDATFPFRLAIIALWLASNDRWRPETRYGAAFTVVTAGLRDHGWTLRSGWGPEIWHNPRLFIDQTVEGLAHLIRRNYTSSRQRRDAQRSAQLLARRRVREHAARDLQLLLNRSKGRRGRLEVYRPPGVEGRRIEATTTSRASIRSIP